MQIAARQIDDFKTERKEVSPPLPDVLRLVPLLLYFSIVISIILSALFFTQLRMAAVKRDDHKRRIAELNAQVGQANAQRSALEVEIKRATDLQAWVAGSRPLQPLVVEIARSMGNRSSLLALRLDREPSAPAQLKLGMQIGTDSTKQLDTTLERILAQDYRPISPQQSMGSGQVDYRSTLIRQTLRASDVEQPTTVPAAQ